MTSINQQKSNFPGSTGDSRDNIFQVLLIEDNPDDVVLITDSLNEALPNRVELSHAKTLNEGLDYSSKSGFDIVLLDLNLPDSNGLNTLSNLLVTALQAPVVILARMDDEELSLKALQAGAQDYLVKGKTDPDLLARVIRYAIERYRLQHELEVSCQREQEAHEFASLEKISQDTQTNVTEQVFGVLRVSQSAPKFFTRLVKQFEKALELSIEKRFLKGEYDIEGEIRRISEQLGQVKAGPRDVIDVYLAALKNLSDVSKPQKAQVLNEEGRFLVLALMGNLTSFYRKYFIGSVNNE
jgi:DNA-binding response OmpR family regulator